jgi:hypothetical protein
MQLTNSKRNTTRIALYIYTMMRSAFNLGVSGIGVVAIIYDSYRIGLDGELGRVLFILCTLFVFEFSLSISQGYSPTTVARSIFCVIIGIVTTATSLLWVVLSSIVLISLTKHIGIPDPTVWYVAFCVTTTIFLLNSLSIVLQISLFSDRWYDRVYKAII